jgi:hypothetical protein
MLEGTKRMRVEGAETMRRVHDAMGMYRPILD